MSVPHLHGDVAKNNDKTAGELINTATKRMTLTATTPAATATDTGDDGYNNEASDDYDRNMDDGNDEEGDDCSEMSRGQ